MNGADLFSWTPPSGARRTDPETSIQAAELHPLVRGADRKAALLAHARNPRGLTDFELADAIDRQQTSAGKRRGELRDLGLIAETDERRPSPSGSPSIVWRITEDGRREAAKIEGSKS